MNGDCVQKDDGNAVLKKLLEADMVFLQHQYIISG
jgi:multimeric flavodoxin WrbA